MSELFRREFAGTQRRARWAAALGFAIACAGCGEVELASGWRQSGISPDGSAGDWASQLTYVEKLDADFGVVNDDSTFYLCLILRDKRAARQLAAGGLEVWFEPEGHRESRIGVRFPLAAPPPPAGPNADSLSSGGRSHHHRREHGNAEFAEGPPRFRTDAIEILGDSIRGPLALGEVPGIRVAIASSPSRSWVYELAIPLARGAGHPYAIGVRPGGVVDVRLEIPTSSRAQPPGMQAGGPEGEPGEPGAGGPPGGDSDEPGGNPGGGGAGGHGGHGGMGGPGGMGGRPDATSEPWQAKARVRLALPM
jgi:hypothetical protein